MYIPRRLPGLRLLTILYGVYVFIWFSLEGALGWVIGMGVATTVVATGYGMQRLVGGRWLPAGLWLLVATGAGGLLGLGSVVVTLVMMALKTGLHGHGPEFTVAEIQWLQEQLFPWVLGGLTAGLGSGLVGWWGGGSPHPGPLPEGEGDSGGEG